MCVDFIRGMVFIKDQRDTNQCFYRYKQVKNVLLAFDVFRNYIFQKNKFRIYDPEKRRRYYQEDITKS